MNFNSNSVSGLFASFQKRFTIPAYQRAYSWEINQWKIFLDDLQEHADNENNYFLGNILLETIEKDINYEVIDGQQRLMTIVIFMAAILKECEKRNNLLEPDVIQEKKAIYFKSGRSNIKLRPVEYDRPFFDEFIINANHQVGTNSVSQKRIKNAYIFFSDELSKLKDTHLIAVLKKIERSEITSVEFSEKKDSALMFELQNNRGKDLTNMEKVKSYLMYQIYCIGELASTNDNIEHLATLFEQIYLLINDLKMNEDSVLIYHCQAYLNGYTYRTIEEIKGVYKNHKTIEWINEFVSSLYSSFLAIKELEISENKYWRRMHWLNYPAFIYPFLIKGMYFFKDEEIKMNRLFHLLEILAYRYQLINSRADFESRLNELLVNFDGDIELLISETYQKLNATYYWADSRVNEYQSSQIYENRLIVKYILWRYEESLQANGYSIGTICISKEEIEHISPITYPDKEPLEAGYEHNENGVYPEEYENYLNSLGNLVLISESHNRSIKNIPFKEKYDSYKNVPLLRQQNELIKFSQGTPEHPEWLKISIENRGEKIISFCENEWNLSNL